MTIYYRPLVQSGQSRPSDAHKIACGWTWFTHVERIERNAPSQVVRAQDVPTVRLERICAPRPALAGMTMSQPRLMGILNVTPDSFSDGGEYFDIDAAIRQAAIMKTGADIIDIGGESTRPGAEPVPAAQEIARIEPVIKAVRNELDLPISIDTRKATVAKAALKAGATMINDVSALSHDTNLARVTADVGVPICLMHAQGDPKTMQKAPHYENVVLDVFDYLEARIAVAAEYGIRREAIAIDPGIGFGKTVEHNLALLRNLGLFHSLGCVILLGASRKRFIGELSDAPNAADRGPGSIGVTLAAAAQGVQIHRVHDIPQTRQALTLWRAAIGTR